jgi:rSAM/selenodomain-associated transferase 1
MAEADGATAIFMAKTSHSRVRRMATIMSQKAIAIFAKTPSLSPVKTRLAKALGTDRAEKIYALCVDCTQETLQKFSAKNPEWDIIWALAEENGLHNKFWINRPFEKIWTGEGDLGTRLYRVYDSLMNKYEAVILTGTDSPQLSVTDFINANDLLRQNGSVIGPAHDGGYYLFGDTVKIEKNKWENTPYSSDMTREEFLKLLDKNVLPLDSKSDLDTKNDIQIILDEMPNTLNLAQKKLIETLKNL